MSAEAIQRIRNEMDSEKNDPNIQAIGEFMVQYVSRYPEAGDKVCTDGKFLTGAYKAIEAYAHKKPRKGNCVAISPDEGFEQVLKYFGIEHKAEGPVIESRFLQDPPAAAVVPATKRDEAPAFSLDLADLL